MVDPGETPDLLVAAAGEGAPRPRAWRDTQFWLVVLVVGFFAISLYAGIVSYFDFQTRNAGDLTIFMQALSSTIRGHPAPFYESYDCMVKTRCSFLLVHPSFVLFAAVPVYALAPSPIVLFVLQSLVVALAALPLYWLTRAVTQSSVKALLSAGLYLVWAPTLGGEAFSFHMESFLPVELFTVALLWQTGRYKLGLLAALLSFITLEVAPIFTFLIGAFFLSPLVERWLVGAWSRWRGGIDRPTDTPAPPRAGLARLRDLLGVRGVRYTLGLMLASLVAYVLLFLFINVWGFHLLGVRAPLLQPGLSGVFYNSSSPVTQSIGTILLSSQTLYTLEFWVILYALVAFIPLLAPRALILSLPWIGWTFLTDSDRYVQLGTQYTLVAAAPLFLGLAYGLLRVPLGPSSSVPAALEVDGSRPIRHGTRHLGFRGRPRLTRVLWAGILTAVVAANLIIVPINPLLSDLGVRLGDPFEDDYQDHSLTIIPGLTWAENLVGVIPPAATVTAPAQVYDLVANDPHAYQLLGRNEESLASSLPLNLSQGPDYVLLYGGFLPALGPNLSANFSNPSLYGVRGYVESTNIGPLLLYERAFEGTAKIYGPSLPTAPSAYFPTDGIVVGRIAELQPNASAPRGMVVTTRPGSHRTGEVWSGPSAFLAPGAYTIHVLVAASGVNVDSAQTPSFLNVRIGGFGAELLNVSVPPSAFSGAAWTNLSFGVATSGPLMDLNVEGYLTDGQAGLAIASIWIVPTGSPPPD
ncbi:MAG: DUF2079 domain-containing protein [Thermoplasmata archaeon]